LERKLSNRARKKVGITGCGGITVLNWGPGCASHPDVDEIYLYDVVRRQAERLKSRLEPIAIERGVRLDEFITVCDTPEEMLAHGLNAAVIATPPDAHWQGAKAALQAGVRSVAIEKPTTDNLGQVMELIGISEQKGAEIVTLPHQNEAGRDPLGWICEQGAIRVMADEWRRSRPATHGRPYKDLGPHVVNRADLLFDRQPIRVKVTSVGELDYIEMSYAAPTAIVVARLECSALTGVAEAVESEVMTSDAAVVIPFPTTETDPNADWEPVVTHRDVEGIERPFPPIEPVWESRARLTASWLDPRRSRTFRFSGRRLAYTQAVMDALDTSYRLDGEWVTPEIPFD
jgi:hypothetical protein